MENVIKDLEVRMQAAVDLLAREFAGVRTGRANTALLDNLRVEAYGNLTPLNQLASLSVPDPKTLVIQPWDASQIGNIEKAIHKSDLGITPSSDGKVLRLAGRTERVDLKQGKTPWWLIPLEASDLHRVASFELHGVGVS